MSAGTGQIQKVDSSGVPAAPPPAGTSRLRGIFIRLFVLTATLMVCLGILEVFLRLVGVKPATPRYGDPVLGFTTRVKSTETFVFPEYGGPLTMKTNNMGFSEDEDTSVTKSPGTIRMIAVGDSQTAGECANRESYPNLLEANLNRTGRKVEVINAGAGRYSPYQYYVKTAHQLAPLHPDYLIVGLYIGNDFMDLVRQDDRPYLSRRSDGRIEAHPPRFVTYADPSKPAGALSSTRVFSLTNQLLGPTVLYQVQRAQMLWASAAGEGLGPVDVVRYMWEVKKLTDISLGYMTQSLLQYVWFHRFPESLATALELNRYVMGQFRELCRQQGIQLVYVVVPTKLQIESDDMREVLSRIGGYRPDYTLERLRAFEDRLTGETLADCARLGIPAVDLRQAMRDRRGNMRLYYPEEMHLGPAGNRVIAGILAEAISGMLPPESRTRHSN